MPKADNDASSFSSPSWKFPALVLFRFTFSYLALYMATFAPRIFRTPIARTYVEVWNPLVAWVARHVFNIASPVEPPIGDTAFEYIVVLCIGMTAVAIAAIWSFADRKRQDYSALHE